MSVQRWTDNIMSAHDDELPPLGDESPEELTRLAEDAPAGEAESAQQFAHLHLHIERLRADRRPPRPEPLTVDERHAYQTAALLRAAAPGAAEPRPEFLAALHATLARELQAPRTARPRPTAA